MAPGNGGDLPLRDSKEDSTTMQKATTPPLHGGDLKEAVDKLAPKLQKSIVTFANSVAPEFCCSGEIAEDPRIYIPELNEYLSFPCQPEQLRKIVSTIASRAPLGRGTEVVLMSSLSGYNNVCRLSLIWNRASAGRLTPVVLWSPTLHGPASSHRLITIQLRR